MFSFLERLKVTLTVLLFWRSKRIMLEAVRAFQATEADGVWHILRGMRRAKDPKLRAHMFTHLLEEQSHADEFVKIYNHYSDQTFVRADYERDDLYGPKAAPWKMLAFVHVGEVDATERFRAISSRLPEGVFRSSLSKIVSDEDGHIDLTHQLLINMGAPRAEIRREIIQVRMKRAWGRWLRTGKRVVDVVATTLLSTIYYLMAPLLFLVARKRLREPYVAYDNNLIKRVVP